MNKSIRKDYIKKRIIEPLDECEESKEVKNARKERRKELEKKIDNNFSSLWGRYPKKLGRKQAYKHYRNSVQDEDDMLRINKALDNFLNSKVVKGDYQYIPYGSTWFFNWEDWETYKEPQKKTKEEIGKEEFDATWRRWQLESGQGDGTT